MKTSSRGFTLIETLFASALMALLLYAIYSTSSTVARQLHTVERAADVAKKVQTSIETAIRFMRSASLNSVVVYNGTSWITPVDATPYTAIRFQRVLGLQTKTSSPLSNPRTLEWVRDPRETANGVDDDGDGQVDEGFLRLTDEDGSKRILVEGVEIFELTRTSRRLMVTVQCAVRDAEKHVQRLRAVENLTLRNN